jgi:hypothetical protein
LNSFSTLYQHQHSAKRRENREVEMAASAIAVSVSSGVMNSLLSKLSILLSDKYKQLKGVRKDIDILSRELAHMSAALETLANLEKLEPQTKVWRDMVRETAYDIEDCIDIFMHNLHRWAWWVSGRQPAGAPACILTDAPPVTGSLASHREARRGPAPCRCALLARSRCRRGRGRGR